MLGRLPRFALVGAVATVTHCAVAVAAVRLEWAQPRRINVPGFAVAFAVGLLGQGRFTFAGARAPFAPALPAFLAVSLAGFALNASAYHLMLRHTALRYDAAPALVPAAAAVCTCAANRWWAFRPARGGA